MAEWAREGCCSFRCSRPSGSWRRFPAAEPAARLAEISPCMRHWPHRRRHLQEHWLSLDLLDTSACACPPRWNHCLALAPAALPSRPVSAVDTTETVSGVMSCCCWNPSAQEDQRCTVHLRLTSTYKQWHAKQLCWITVQLSRTSTKTLDQCIIYRHMYMDLKRTYIARK